MKITVHKVRNRKLRETLRDAANLFLRELLPQHIIQNLDVGITFRTHMKDMGSCQPWYHSTGRPKRFEIELAPRGYNTKLIIKTLGHECTHVKQFALGEMFEPTGKVTLWKSRKYLHDEIPYTKHPWEIEACGNEASLWELWRNRRRA